LVIGKNLNYIKHKSPVTCELSQYIRIDPNDDIMGFTNETLTKCILDYGTDTNTNSLVPNLNLDTKKILTGTMFNSTNFSFSLEKMFPERTVGCAIKAYVKFTSFFPVYVSKENSIAVILSAYAISDSLKHSRNLTHYSIHGWAPLNRKYLYIKSWHVDDEDLLDKIVPTKIINVRLYNGHDHISRTYYQSYDSDSDFTVGEVFSRIVETLWSYVKDYPEMKGCCDNLSLVSFDFDSETCMVYPNCDS